MLVLELSCSLKVVDSPEFRRPALIDAPLIDGCSVSVRQSFLSSIVFVVNRFCRQSFLSSIVFVVNRFCRQSFLS